MFLCLLAATSVLCPPTPQTVQASGVPKPSLVRVDRALKRGKGMVEGYFGRPFPRGFEVVVAPKRSDFDAESARRWKMPASEKWMVGAGASDFLLLLAPDRWKFEAVEHDGESDVELQEIVAHELVHVYHAQTCPKHDFEGMDELGWFVEGLAVRVSGQLERSHHSAAARAIREGKAPRTLSDAWSGRYRYGVAGSMAKFVEVRWGKQAVADLLQATTNNQALTRLGISQDKFLSDWADWVGKTK